MEENSAAPKSGYVYAVCQRGRFECCKIGFTTSECPEAYCHTQFSRTMAPLHHIRFHPTAFARAAETSVHHMLHRYHVSNELFDLSGPNGLADLDAAFDIVTIMDKRSGKPIPTANPPSMQDLKPRKRGRPPNVVPSQEELARRALKEREQKEREAARETAAEELRARQAALEEEKLRRKQARVNIKEAQAAEAREAERAADELLDRFIAEKCVTGPMLKVESVQLLAAFCLASTERMDSKKLKSKMLSRGFEHRAVKVDGMKGVYFLKIGLQMCAGG